MKVLRSIYGLSPMEETEHYMAETPTYVTSNWRWHGYAYEASPGWHEADVGS